MESTQSLDPETPTQSVRGMCPDTCVGCAPRGMCPPGSRPCPTIFVLWYSKLSKVVKSFTMVTTVVGNFSPYSRTKRIPPAPRPILSTSGSGCSADLPPTPQGSQTRLSFAHTLNTGIVAFGAGLSQGWRNRARLISVKRVGLCALDAVR